MSCTGSGESLLPPATTNDRSVRPQPDPTEAAANVVSGFSRTTANLAAGQQLFKQACVVCHGEDGKGGHGAGAPLVGVTDLAAAIQTVTAGRNDMPPFSNAFTTEQIRDVSAYVVEALAGRAR